MVTKYNFVWPNHFLKQSSAILMKASIVNAEGQQVDGVIINVKLQKPLNISFGGTVTIPYIFPKDYFRAYLISLLGLWERNLNRINTVTHESVLLFHIFRS